MNSDLYTYRRSKALPKITRRVSHSHHPPGMLRRNNDLTYLLSLFFFMYFMAQLLQGRLPSHLVFLDRQRSQLAHSACPFASFFSSILAVPTKVTRSSLVEVRRCGAIRRISLQGSAYLTRQQPEFVFCEFEVMMRVSPRRFSSLFPPRCTAGGDREHKRALKNCWVRSR